jgi:hypothetical protein
LLGLSLVGERRKVDFSISLKIVIFIRGVILFNLLFLSFY